MNHTPGPWKWVEGGADSQGLIVGRNNEDVCDFGVGTQYDEVAGSPPLPADRALILAAPDLYEAISQSMQYLDQTIGPCDEGCDCLLHGLHAALAKAEGR